MKLESLNNDFPLFRIGCGFHPEGFFVRFDFHRWGIRLKPFS